MVVAHGGAGFFWPHERASCHCFLEGVNIQRYIYIFIHTKIHVFATGKIQGFFSKQPKNKKTKTSKKYPP